MEQYDPLAVIIQIAAECCDEAGQISKAHAVMNLRDVLRDEPELGEELLRRMAKHLKNTNMPAAMV